MNRDAGVLVLIKLIQMSAADSAKSLSYSDIGVRFGISRTHVRTRLQDAAQHGDVSLSGRGGHLVELRPSILHAFDRFVAAAMSGHDCFISSRANGWRMSGGSWIPDRRLALCISNGANRCQQRP
jgi:hypothetical protein